MKNQIKWRKKDKELLKKKVKNHNAKINRLLKKGYDEALLPNKIKYKELTDKITTRKDYNFEIKLIDTFTKRNSEKIDNVKKSKRGAILPSYLEKQIKLKLNRINRIRKQQRQTYENLPATDRNIPIGGTAKENEGITNTAMLRDRTFKFENMSKKDLKAYVLSLEEYNISLDKKNNLYRENYYKSIDNTMTEEQAEKLKEILDKIDTETIVTKYYTDANLKIRFNYEPQEQNALYEILIDSWNKVLENRENDSNG